MKNSGALRKEEEVARRFQSPGKKAYVATGLVEKADVFAVFLHRNEFEVVSDRVVLKDVKEIRL